jgi:CubicO group peptidase (beta-lactamase class C family)
VDALRLVATWPVGRVAAGVVDGAGDKRVQGESSARFAWASVTKMATALAALVACEEGSIALDDVVLPSAATVRHLLAHASGLAPEGPPRQLAGVGTRRIYSNAGFELLGSIISERSGITFERYLSGAVLVPLGMEATRLEGSPAAGLVGSLEDLVVLAAELISPTLIARSTLEEATAVAFPGLDGVLPGFGPQHPCDWGLGFELRDAKSPHWTSPACSARTFGHFGRSGSFLWVDPDRALALAALSDREFGDWAKQAWPALGAAVVAEWDGLRSPR